MPLIKLEYRGWTIEVTQASHFKAWLWRPGAKMCEPFNKEASSRDGILKLAKEFIDGIAGRG